MFPPQESGSENDLQEIILRRRVGVSPPRSTDGSVSSLSPGNSFFNNFPFTLFHSHFIPFLFLHIVIAMFKCYVAEWQNSSHCSLRSSSQSSEYPILPLRHSSIPESRQSLRDAII